MDTLIKDWDGEYVLCRYDKAAETWIFIAIHSTALGKATGGTRMKSYLNPNEALRDAMRLAEGMTYKFAGVDFPRGGAKAVLSVPDNIDHETRTGLLKRYAQLLHNLNGTFETGPDLGTNPDDMALIAETYPGVFGCPSEAGGYGDPGPHTALGVFSGIQASCEHHFKSSDLSGRSVLVQGTGSVGRPLIQLLLEAGCQVKFSEMNPIRVEEIQNEFNLPFVEPEAVYAEPCDVFAPCATGGILNSETIPRLRCTIVAGGANNQLDRPEDGESLYQRNILYAPDYINNAGGAIYLIAVEAMDWSNTKARERVIKIGETLKMIFHESAKQGISPAMAADQLAKEKIYQAKT
ncbi:MAG: hypothetical protein GTO18_16585 [Anaerolineales bacterium]|nr:hypothetical protein [Anaerolineales bacterium]